MGDRFNEMCLAMKSFADAFELKGNFTDEHCPGIYSEILDVFILEKEPIYASLNKPQILDNLVIESDKRLLKCLTFINDLLRNLISLN